MSEKKSLKIGHFELIKQIYKGPTSLVYLTRHEFIDRQFVIKLLRLSDEQSIKRVHREIGALSRLYHPNNVQIVDAGMVRNRSGAEVPYIALEYVQGQTLRKMLGHEVRLSAEVTVRLAMQILYALDEAHSSGIVHRDIKPENLVITTPRHGMFNVKVIDYGIANPLDNTTIHAPTFTSSPNYGTPHYMAPEYIENKSPSAPQADIYSLGVVMYECLSGKRPFDGQEPMSVLYQHVHTDPVKIEELIPIEPNLARIIARAMSKDPADRYANAGEFIDALSALDVSALREYSPIPVEGGLAGEKSFATLDLKTEAGFTVEAPAPRKEFADVRPLSNMKPTIWVLDGAPAVNHEVVERALARSQDSFDIEHISQDQAEERLAQLESGEVLPPWVVLFGDMHVILESALLAHLSDRCTVSRILLSTHANADLFVEAAHYCGVDDQLTHPLEAADITASLERAITRTRKLYIQMDEIRAALRHYRERTLTLTQQLTSN